jgi:hypothetical protein
MHGLSLHWKHSDTCNSRHWKRTGRRYWARIAGFDIRLDCISRETLGQKHYTCIASPSIHKLACIYRVVLNNEIITNILVNYYNSTSLVDNYYFLYHLLCYSAPVVMDNNKNNNSMALVGERHIPRAIAACRRS